MKDKGKRKMWIVMALLLVGFGLVCIPVVLAMVGMSRIGIIGGAGMHTFLFVFSSAAGGAYPLLAFAGAVMIVTAVIMAVVKKKG